MFVAKLSQTDTSLENKDILFEGADASLVRPYPSTAWSNNSISFTCPNSSRDTFVDRVWIVEASFLVTYTGTPAVPGGPIPLNQYDALRQFPLNSIIKTSILTLDNQSFSWEPSATVSALSKYWTLTQDQYSPIYPDKYNNYNDGIGAVNNPLGGYNNSTGYGGHIQPRGAYSIDNIIITPTTTALTYTIREQLIIPPLLRESGENSLGFTNFTDSNLQLILTTTLERLVSHASSSPSTVTNISVNLNSAPILYRKHFTAKNWIPKTLNYKCDTMTLYRPLIGGTMPNGFNDYVATSNIQLSTIPTWILFWIGEGENSKTALSTDTAVNIDGVSITFLNTGGILSSLSEHEIYDLSRRNGLTDSFEEYTQQTSILTNTGVNQIATSGSFCKLFFGKDIPIPDEGLYIGKPGNYNLQINCHVKNKGILINIPTFYIISDVQGHITMDPEFGVNKTNGIVLTPSTDLIPISYEDIMIDYAGGFKDTMNKLNRWLKENKIISRVAKHIPVPGAKTISNIAEEFGYGEEKGGKMLSKAELKKLIRKY